MVNQSWPLFYSYQNKSKFETRAFAYPDIISWLESKVYNKPVYEIIREKYLSGKRLVGH